jgi:MYXO-CTERM domain-containing protein
MAIMPEENFTLGRFPDGLDSDNNEVDFFTNMPPSPGEPNTRGGGGGGGAEEGCGCGSKDPGGSGPAPSEAFAPLGMLVGLLSLAAVRRRED